MAEDITFVSNSAVSAFKRCEQLYDYKYLQRLEPKQRAPHLDFGIHIHLYLERYYKQFLAGQMPDTDRAHKRALKSVLEELRPKVKPLITVAFAAGADDLAETLRDMPGKLKRIAERYYRVRGKPDIEEYEVLLVEHDLRTRIHPRIMSVGVADLLLRSYETGRTLLVEHKTAGDIPSYGFRLRDTQTVLYAEQLQEELQDLEIDDILWNYLRTKEPTIPQLLKNRKVPTLSVAQGMDTTWEIYQLAANEYGVDLSNPIYDETRERLKDREIEAFFPRIIQPILSDRGIMIEEFTRASLNMRRFRALRHEGKIIPMRVLDFLCDRCDFHPLCTAAIISGDESDIRKMRYNVSKPRRPKVANQSL